MNIKTRTAIGLTFILFIGILVGLPFGMLIIQKEKPSTTYIYLLELDSYPESLFISVVFLHNETQQIYQANFTFTYEKPTLQIHTTNNSINLTQYLSICIFVEKGYCFNYNIDNLDLNELIIHDSITNRTLVIYSCYCCGDHIVVNRYFNFTILFYQILSEVKE